MKSRFAFSDHNEVHFGKATYPVVHIVGDLRSTEDNRVFGKHLLSIFTTGMVSSMFQIYVENAVNVPVSAGDKGPPRCALPGL